MIAMNPSKIVLLTLLFSLTATGQMPFRDQLEINIEKFKPTPGGFDVSVSVKNKGTRPVFIPRRPEKEVMLASLGIQQWDEQLGWQFVSPCSDVAPMSTVELRQMKNFRALFRSETCLTVKGAFLSVSGRSNVWAEKSAQFCPVHTKTTNNLKPLIPKM